MERRDLRARSEIAYRSAELQEIIFCQASVIGGWGLPISSRGPTIPLETNFGWAPGFLDRLSQSIPDYLEREPTEHLYEEVAVLSFPGAFTYGHWIIDIAARCETLARYRELSTIKFIVPKPFFHWASPILRAYNIAERQLVEIGDRDKILCQKLLVPALMRINDYLPPDPHKVSLHRLRRYSTIAMESQAPPLKLFVKHMPQTSRGTRATLGNAADIQGILEDHGFLSIVPGELSVEDQIRLFSNCSVIVGEDSSALHNCVWNRASSHLVVLSSPQRHNILHECMTDLLGQTCEYVYGDLISEHSFEVDRGPLLEAIDRAS